MALHCRYAGARNARRSTSIKGGAAYVAHSAPIDGAGRYGDGEGGGGKDVKSRKLLRQTCPKEKSSRNQKSKRQVEQL